MTTPSYKVLARVVPVAAFLAVALAVALAASPDTFRYRGWPKPARSPALQSLVGLTPQLDARDPIARPRVERVAVAAAQTTRVAVPSPTLVARVAAPAKAPSRKTGGAAPQGWAVAGHADTQAQRAVAGRAPSGGDRSGQRGGSESAKRSPERGPATSAREARVAREAQTYDPRPSSAIHSDAYYARRSYESRDYGTVARHAFRAEPRRPESSGPRAANWAHAGHSGAGRHLGRGRG